MSGVTEREKKIIKEQVERGDGDQMLPFSFMGWVECIANTAWDWQFSGLLNNVHTAKDGDFSQAEKITHTGALLVGTYDNFTSFRNGGAHNAIYQSKGQMPYITEAGTRTRSRYGKSNHYNLHRSDDGHQLRK